MAKALILILRRMMLPLSRSKEKIRRRWLKHRQEPVRRDPWVSLGVGEQGQRIVNPVRAVFYSNFSLSQVEEESRRVERNESTL